MIKQLEAKYTLFDSIEAMLTPETLSNLLQTSIRAVRRSPRTEPKGTSDNSFEWVTVSNPDGETQRFILKRIRLENDWLMLASGDVLCRSVTLWQYGILDKLSAYLDHTVIACSRDDDGWAILMKDVSPGMHPALSEYPPLAYVQSFLDAMAYMHATFWKDDTLADAHLGLNDNAGVIGMTGVLTAQKFANLPSPLSTWIMEGWETLQTMFEPEVAEIYRQLTLNPQPLYDTLSHYPATLIHGDFRGGTNPNISYMVGQSVPVCVFDWQIAGYALNTVDLTWFINRVQIRAVIETCDSANYYRERLEHYLGVQLDSAKWQAMLDLGFLADAMRMGVLEGYFLFHNNNEENQLNRRILIEQYNEQIRAGVRWLELATVTS